MPAKVFYFFFSTFCTEIITFNPSLLFVNKTDRRVEREGGTYEMACTRLTDEFQVQAILSRA
jgi:hypothetical protein